MILKSIDIFNFRNIKQAKTQFCRGVNIFFGGNAQGKTNILEAISVCMGKGLRGAKNYALQNYDDPESGAQVKLNYVNDLQPDREHLIDFRLNGGKQTVTLNGIAYRSAGELYGELKYIAFTPEHLQIINGAPELRRDYMDAVAAMQNTAHKSVMRAYRRALKQANAAAGGEQVSIWFGELAKNGINITYGRLKHLFAVTGIAAEIYARLTGGTETLGVLYESNVFGRIRAFGDVDFEDKQKLYRQYISKLDELYAYGAFSEAEAKVGAGVHRDDCVFTINGKYVKDFASQGQMRSIAVVLKLAEAQIIRDSGQEHPVILLDEVLGELDEERRRFVVRHFADSQVFITSCNLGDFAGMTGEDGVQVYNVDNGIITATNEVGQSANGSY
jgi:DNA replication and repair protein RecF